MADLKFGLQLDLKGDKLVVSGLQGVRSEVVALGGDSTRSTGVAAENNKRLASSFNTVKTAAAAAGGVLAALGFARLADDAIDYADAWKLVNNQLRQVTGSEQQLIGVRKNLLATALETNTALDATISLYSDLFRSTRDLNVSQERVAAVTKTINNLFLAGGKAASETAGAIVQLSQGLAAGALRGDEFNSVAEGAPRIMDALAEHLKMTRGELREFAAQGGITAEIMVDALEAYESKAQAMADLTERTFGQKMVNAKTNVQQFAGEFDALNAAVDVAGDYILGLSANLDVVVNVGGLVAALFGGKMVSSLITYTAAQVRNELATRAAIKAAYEQAIVEQAKAAALVKSMQGTVNATTTTTAYAAAQQRLAAANATATAATAAMVGRVGLLRGVLAFVGGPVGVAVTAASAIWLFRDSLFGTKDEVRDFTGEVDNLIKSMQNMGKTSAQVKLDEINQALDDLNKKIVETNRVYGDANPHIVEILEPLLKQKELLEQNKKRLEDAAKAYGQAGDGVSDLEREIDKLIETSELFALSEKDLAEYAINADKAHQDYLATLQRIKDSIDPAAAATRRLTEEYNLLVKAIGLGDASTSDLHKWIDANVMIATTTRQAAAEVAEITEQANPMADAWVEATKRIDESFADAWAGAFDSFEDFGDSILDSLKRLLAEMAHLAITKPILIQMGLGGGSVPGLGGSAGGGGAGGGGAGGFNFSSLSNLSSLKNLVGNGLGTLGGYGISAVNGVGEFGAQALYNMGFKNAASTWSVGASNYTNTLVNTGNSIGGAVGADGLSTNTAAGVGMIANAVAGYAGSWVGNKAGEAIFGKQAESSIGATVGGAIGSIWGPIGTAIGAAIGGLADAAFGGDGKKRAALGLVAAPSSEFAGVADAPETITESGLRLKAYTKRAGSEGNEYAAAMLQQFSAIDSSLLDLSQSLFGVSGIDLSGDSLTGKAHQAGKDGGNFFGSAIFNGISEADLKNASREFIIAWADAVNAEMGTALDFGALLDLAAEGEDAGDAIIRLNAQFGGANAVLKELNLTLFDSNVAGVSAADGLIQAFGGLETFAAATSAYSQAFVTDAERMDAITAELESQFGSLGYALPKTRDAFTALVSGLDLTTASGQNAFAALTGASAMMDQYYTALEQGVGRLRLSNLDNFAEQITLDLLGTDKNRYNYAKSQADSLAALIPSLNSVESIQATLDDITRLSAQAYNYLDDAGKRQQGAEYIDFIEEVKVSADTAIAEAQKAQSDATVAALKEGISTASKQMADELVAALRGAASELMIPAQVLENASIRFAERVNEIGYGTEFTR